ncbi:MAG: nucleoside-diphosphate-sugar epimerase [Patiriisocius sp.]|jgi:UDP-glucuronate 4-epimerase
MNILVTGAAGFIGSHTVERLLGLGHTVYGLDNFSPYYDIDLKKMNVSAIKKAGAHFIEADLRTDDLSKYLPSTLDFVFHFAAHPGISASSTFKDYVSNNILATQRLLDYIETKSRRPFFANIATSSIYGLEATLTENEVPLPASWYGVTKLAAEQLVLAYARRGFFKGCSLRLYSVYGPRERPDKLYTRLIACVLQNKPFTLFNGSEKHLRSFTYVQDIIDGIVSVIGNEEVCNTQIFNLGTEEENTTATGIETVEKLLNTTIDILPHPARPGDQSRTKANIDKARRVLNYNPTTGLEEGLKAQIEWYKDRFL